jgi:hypothetical protein
MTIRPKARPAKLERDLRKKRMKAAAKKRKQGLEDMKRFEPKRFEARKKDSNKKLKSALGLRKGGMVKKKK